jgi:hypothetical protein
MEVSICSLLVFLNLPTITVGSSPPCLPVKSLIYESIRGEAKASAIRLSHTIRTSESFHRPVRSIWVSALTLVVPVVAGAVVHDIIANAAKQVASIKTFLFI